MPFKSKRTRPQTLFGCRIRDKRTNDDLSIREAAEQVGLHYTALARFENGTHRPAVDNFVAVVDWLGAPDRRAMEMLRELATTPEERQ